MKKIIITCIGDSLTERGYIKHLKSKLGLTYQVKNSGVSAHTMLKCGLECDGTPRSYWNTQKFKIA